MSTALSYALITPTYWRDFERCVLLTESVQRWVVPDVRHYLVVARRDVPLFRGMLSSRTQLLVVEDIIPRWLIRVPGIRRAWLSLRTRPVKNWILQQIVKLSTPAVVTEDVLLYADSDMFFIEPYDPRSYERDGAVPLFLETGQRGLIGNNDRWHRAAARLLGLPLETGYDSNFVNQLICWRRLNALAALERVEQVQAKSWVRAIAPLGGFSEYTLYGLYVARVLGERSGHWHDGVIRTLNHWRPEPLDVPALRRFKAARAAEHHSVMVSSKSNTPVAAIREVFFQEDVDGPRAAKRGDR
jgi:hypothetical protein